MGNTAMCKVCGTDKGLKTATSQTNLDPNASPEYYCEEHYPLQPPVTLVRALKTGAQLQCSLNHYSSKVTSATELPLWK